MAEISNIVNYNIGIELSKQAFTECKWIVLLHNTQHIHCKRYEQVTDGDPTITWWKKCKRNIVFSTNIVERKWKFQFQPNESKSYYKYLFCATPFDNIRIKL